MIEMGINDNVHTEYNVTILSAKKDSFAKHIANYISSLSDEKELKLQYNAQAAEVTNWLRDTILGIR